MGLAEGIAQAIRETDLPQENVEQLSTAISTLTISQSATISQINTPKIDRFCEFCQNHGHPSQSCRIFATRQSRIRILEARGACKKCCLVHEVGRRKCAENRQKCRKCRGKRQHLKWLCPNW
ncbi:unnamed protein product [Caenorhabditis angaria]|uniref:Uncharacterized protein n=1 Tax=Caenorhabditis angaria TaxID=860376 RepID=A0A9P1I923_9PELO|nr:unnamed protein product [Caenorhabditis angaria]